MSGYLFALGGGAAEGEEIVADVLQGVLGARRGGACRHLDVCLRLGECEHDAPRATAARTLGVILLAGCQHYGHCCEGSGKEEVQVLHCWDV